MLRFKFQGFHQRKDIFAQVLDYRSKGIFVGMLVEIECAAQEMPGRIGDKELGGRSCIAFDEIDQSENFIPAKEFFIDRLRFYGVGIGKAVAVL